MRDSMIDLITISFKDLLVTISQILNLHNPVVFLLLMFLACILIGFVAVLAGVGGGVLFTPLMMAFTTVNPDIVRATGLAIATMSSLMSSKPYLSRNIANFRLALFSAIPYTIFAIIGSIIGLHITAVLGNLGKNLIRFSLGILVLFIALLFVIKGKRVEWPNAPENKHDALANTLGLDAQYFEVSLNRTVMYKVVNIQWGMLCFVGVGLVSGMFGLGAGWAIVPVYNLVMYLPLKVASATSLTVIGIGDTAAMWVYINGGAMIPLFVIPCLLGVVIGAQVGTRMMPKLKAGIIRWVVITVMIIAGLRLIQQALPTIMGVI